MKRKEVLIAVIGGFFGAFLTMCVGLFVPVGVVAQSQNQDVEFGTITCRQIKVVDSFGRTQCSIYGFGQSLSGGVVSVRDKDGEVGAVMSATEYGGRVRVYDKEGKGRVTMGIGESGGVVGVFDKDGRPGAAMTNDEHGGIVNVINKDGRPGALMSNDEHGGRVGALGKNGGMALMTNDEHGGRVGALGKGTEARMTTDEQGGRVEVLGIAGFGEARKTTAAMFTGEHGGRVDVGNNQGKKRATMGVNAYGDGAVSTWDKNGYRQ